MALSFTVPVETGDMLSSSLGGGVGRTKNSWQCCGKCGYLRDLLCLFLPCLAHPRFSISICEHSFVIAELAGFALYDLEF